MKLPWISREQYAHELNLMKELVDSGQSLIDQLLHGDELLCRKLGEQIDELKSQIVQLRLERDEALNRLLELAIGTPLFPTKEPEQVVVAAEPSDDHEGISAPQQRNIRRQMQSTSRTNKASFNTGETGALVRKAMELSRADMQREAQERAAKQAAEGAVQ